jgi:flagellar P-ring protein precursor FlgI
LATLAAQRPNQLIGYGLVVGLQGTGDDASVPFTTQSMKAMLSQMGVRIDGPLTDFETAATAARVDIKNTAAVLVTAELPGLPSLVSALTSMCLPSAKPLTCVAVV